MTVTIDNETALDMLVERVREWTDDDDVVALFATYYEGLVDEGAFEGSDFDVMAIVDNDYVNWTEYGTREEIAEPVGNHFTEDNILAESGDLILYYAG